MRPTAVGEGWSSAVIMFGIPSAMAWATTRQLLLADNLDSLSFLVSSRFCHIIHRYIHP